MSIKIHKEEIQDKPPLFYIWNQYKYFQKFFNQTLNEYIDSILVQNYKWLFKPQLVAMQH